MHAPGKLLYPATWTRHQNAMKSQADLNATMVEDSEQDSIANDIPEMPYDAISGILPGEVGENTLDLEQPAFMEATESESDTQQSDTEDMADIDPSDDDSDDGQVDSTSDKFFTTFELNDLAEVSTWQIHSSGLRKAIDWAIWKLDRSVSNVAFNTRPGKSGLMLQAAGNEHDEHMSFFSVMRRIKRLTGLQPQKLPCCICGCALYEDPLSVHCVHCNEEIYETVHLLRGPVKRARKYFFYWSPIPRLLLLWAVPKTASAMREYLDIMLKKEHNPDDLIRDFFDSRHFQRLKARGYFEDLRTLVLAHSADGASVVKQKNKSVWLFLLTILNLPPEDRYWEMMVTGLIPAEPVDLSSYFQPLLRDLRVLADGVDAIDGSQPLNPRFKLRGHLCLITGDFPAIAKMMQMKGANGYSPCRFCGITGIYHESSRHTYYPLNSRQFSTNAADTSDNVIRLRTDLRGEILLVNAARKEDLNRIHGISGLSPFLSIQTIHFPQSWGLDIMHLFGNVAKLFWSLWSGKLLPPTFDDEASSSYVLSEAQLADIGLCLEKAAKTVPVSVSQVPRDIHRHVKSYKATEWFDWIMIFSVPMLSGRLPDYALHHWILFRDAARLAVQVQVSQAMIQVIESKLREFVERAETIYYQGISHRLPLCTSQLHSLLHVASNLKDLGPSFVYWQYGLEQYVGLLAPLATSKSQIATSIYNGLEYLENVRYLKLMYSISSQSSNGHQVDLVTSEGHIYGGLRGKGYSSTMTKVVNQHLNRWYSEFHGVDVPTSTLQCQEWMSVRRLVTVGTAQDFTVARTTSRSQGRSRDIVCYANAGNEGEYGFGRVVSLFQHQCPITGSIFSWVLIDSFVQAQDTLTGDIFYQKSERAAGSRIMDIHDIVAPVGLVKRDRLTWWIVQGYRIWLCS